MCYEAKDWDALNENIILLSKRRSQLKQVNKIVFGATLYISDSSLRAETFLTFQHLPEYTVISFCWHIFLDIRIPIMKLMSEINLSSLCTWAPCGPSCHSWQHSCGFFAWQCFQTVAHLYSLSLSHRHILNFSCSHVVYINSYCDLLWWNKGYILHACFWNCHTLEFSSVWEISYQDSWKHLHLRSYKVYCALCLFSTYLWVLLFECLWET